MDLTELCRQHEELHVLAGQLSRAVADDRVPQSIGALRWQFARLLMAHLALEDRIFYPGVQRMADEQLRTTAQRLQIEMGPLAEAFSAYLSRWSDHRIAGEWAGFCQETREIVKSLVTRIDREERTLIPLLNKNLDSPVSVRRAG